MSMSKERVSWLKGDLPTWIATGMLLILGWGGKTYFDYVSSKLSLVERSVQDIIVLQTTQKNFEKALEELKSNQREIVTELRGIRLELRK